VRFCCILKCFALQTGCFSGYDMEELLGWNRSRNIDATTPTKRCTSWQYDQSVYVSTYISAVRGDAAVGKLVHKFYVCIIPQLLQISYWILISCINCVTTKHYFIKHASKMLYVQDSVYKMSGVIFCALSKKLHSMKCSLVSISTVCKMHTDWIFKVFCVLTLTDGAGMCSSEKYW